MFKNIFNLNINVIDIVVCFILGFICSCSSKYIENRIFFMDLEIIIKSILVGLELLVTTIIARCIISNNREKFNFKSKLFSDKKGIVFCTIIIFICWLPVLIALYPGTMINDSWGQLKGFYLWLNGYSLSSHHPVLDTIILGIIILPLSKLTGNWHLFIFIYVILQAIITSLVFSYSLNFMKNNLKLSNIWIIISLLIYCFLPCIVCAVQTVSKDALFSWIYVLFFIKYINIILTDGDCFKDKKEILWILGSAILCILTKKVAFYIVILSLGILLLFNIKNKDIFSKIVIILLVFYIIVIPIMDFGLNISKGWAREKYSLLFQQTARYVKDYENEVTESEKVVLDNLLHYENLAERYNPTSADFVKDWVTDQGKENYLNYFIVWGKQGLKHPDSYIKATASMWSGWFSFYEYKPLLNMDWHDRIDNDLIPESASVRNEFSNKSSQKVSEIYDKLYNLPILKVILSYGFYALLIPVFCFITLLKSEKKKYSLVVLPSIISVIFGCLLSPVTASEFESMRYLYPIVYTSPLLVMLCVYCYNYQKYKE